MPIDFEALSALIHQRNSVSAQIAGLIGRPALMGHVGEAIASVLFDIALEESAACPGWDGRFRTGLLAGRTVNVKWYGKMESLLDVRVDALPDYFLVMTGPAGAALSSKGECRPWCVESVFLFDALALTQELCQRGVKIGMATSVRKHQWEAAMIYPTNRSGLLCLDAEGLRRLAMLGANSIDGPG